MSGKTMTLCALVTAAAVLAAGATARADNSFYRVLLSKPNATRQDGARCVYALIGGDPSAPFEDVLQGLSAKDAFKDEWARSVDESLTKCELAYMICKALDIKGGLTMRIFGVWPGYALRELVFMKIMARGAGGKYVSGGELLAVLSRAENYMKQHEKKEG